ncbi:MAG TPA: [NiFe]-hydrogenase assembly, chaperone, HybE [Gammaproteobacteria bacterium]|nr:[NiFe]-hydrogenase assembly, chaperone, HybE [Gammaproteobacteria bacterium]
MTCPDYLSQGLERAFRRIQQARMRHMPVINDDLRVEAVGFRSWQGHSLGVMVTPWFMGLMLIPREGDDWSGLRMAEKCIHEFPSGAYEFTVGEEDGIGRFQMCTLFSPMSQFADQQTAVATAEAVLRGLIGEERRGSAAATDISGEGNTTEPAASPQRLEERPLSRRDLLRGRFLRRS